MMQLDDITQILWVQRSQFDTNNYQIYVAVAMNKHMTRPYPVFQEWLFYFSILTYDYENDGLGTAPEERHENIEKLRHVPEVSSCRDFLLDKLRKE